MPREDDYGSVLLYYLIVGVLGAAFQLFWSLLFRFLGFHSPLESMLAERDVAASNPVTEFLLSPILLLCGLYIVAGVCHLLLMMMRGAKNGFGTSTRVFAFSYSPIVFSAIPFLGNFIAFVWMIRCAIIGLREAHETDGTKAGVAVLVPVFLLFLLMLLAMLAAVAVGLLEKTV